MDVPTALDLSKMAPEKEAEERKKRVVIVFGATGQQGQPVVEALLESGQFHVRGATRNPSSPTARKLTAMGALMMPVDMTVEEQVRAAFSGAYAAFVVTSSWDPSQAGSREFDIGAMHARIAKEVGVRHYIWSTLPSASQTSNGMFHLGAFDNKARVDEVVRAQGFDYTTYVLCNCYFQNLPITELPDGTLRFNLPFDEDTVFEGFDVEDLGSAVATAIEHPNQWGQGSKIVLTALQAPMREWLSRCTAATGRKAVLGPFSPPAGKSEQLVEFLEQMYLYFKEVGGVFPGLDSSTGAAASKRPLTTWEQYLKEKTNYAAQLQ